MAKDILAYLKQLFQEHESKNRNSKLEPHTFEAFFISMLAELFELRRQKKLQALIDEVQDKDLVDSSTEE